MTPPIDTHIILVHGSYHTPWHMRFLQDALEQHGYTTSAPALPSMGNQALLSDDAHAVQKAIEAAAATHSSILPVFHSYAGAPGAEAIAALSPSTRAKVVRVIYLAAFILPRGGAMSSPDPDAPHPWAITSNNWRSVPEPIPVFYNDMKASFAAQAASHCLPQWFPALFSQTTSEGWRLCEATYVVCTEDCAIPRQMFWEGRFKPLLEETDVRPKWRFLEIQSGHSPFLSKIEETALLLRREAGEDV
ncbi:Alpha/beta hydrolase fold-1 [Neohortaea acidophila]|uniref:Alpha/beta hydrolase fold-1 n=1 Tax=Neohortaea acidophila TaxID=245834 RepID=A0A6A6PS92_9PEZI|nr:Alpha/beta hydrolase fold-1 [Neohortaea acidophila]KAF2482852.1 Alpha/beta hydrolase fold-1 [Neohortaea acidophila]